ncbi:MAG: serine kinase [Deltaproteobacteria bacterium]|nr:serine kinase [Candidatus Zymogenaceae bacterium]
MELGFIVKNLKLMVRSGSENLTVDVNGGYVGDLLSDVIANSKQGDIWITRQIHQNIVAVATLKDLAGIILVDNNEPARETLEKAIREMVPVMVSELPCFETAGRIYQLIAAREK